MIKYLKIFLVLLSVAIGIAPKSLAQDDAKEFEILKDYKVDTFLLDFAVPDMPAFKALGTDPSEILRPSDIQKFAIQMNPFYSNGNAVIPKSFAMSVAPWKLLSKKWTLEDYRTDPLKRLAYNTSFSLGTSQEDKENPESRIAFGIRTSFRFKDADPMINSKFLDELYDLLGKEVEALDDFVDDWLEKNNITQVTYMSSDSIQEVVSNDFKEYKKNKKDLNGTISNYIKDFKKKNWNASRIDFAFAIIGSSSDSLAKNTGFHGWNTWITASIKSGKAGQFLIGGVAKKVTGTDVDATLNVRYYFGNQHVRAFTEYQRGLGIGENEKTGLVNLGTELRVGSRFWLEFYGGVENVYGDAEKSRFRTALNVKYSFNK